MKSLCTILVLFLYLTINAQYEGSNGDGFTFSGITGVRVDGVIVTFSALYQGSDGDGFSHSLNEGLFINGSMLDIFSGGNGDGFAFLQNSNLLLGASAQIYFGGEGDGFAHEQSSQILLSGSVAQIYFGGEGDGFSESLEADLLLNGSFVQIYFGGDSDGSADDKVFDQLLDGMSVQIYFGGEGDGFSSFKVSDLLLDGMLAQIYFGGNGDGNTSARLDGFILQVLPVEWISFDAVQQEKAVLLLWTVASEINSDYYVIEKSANAYEFEEIQQVASKGTISTINDYQNMDVSPNRGINYYRIKQVDFDGDYSYSVIRSVYFNATSGELDFTIFPNPNRNRMLDIEVTGVQNDEISKLIIFDSNGKLLTSKEIASSERLSLSQEWSAGTYFVQLLVGEKVKTKSLFIID